MKNPYNETVISQNTVIREFSENIDPIELMWHRDDETRKVIPINQTDWKIQLENQLPIVITEPVEIKRHEWHRLIKGNGDLVVRVCKF